MRTFGFDSRGARLRAWIWAACIALVTACNQTPDAAPPPKGPPVELPPPVPFEAEGGAKARGWSVPPESAGEVLSRLQRGEKLEAVLQDLEARKPGILSARKAPLPPPPAPGAQGIGALDPAAASQLVPGAEKPAVARVMRRFELIEGQPIRVKEVEARSGMWRVRFSGVPDAAGKPSDKDREVWVSSDAKLMFAGGTALDAEIEQLEADRAFARCLRDAGVRAYVDPRAPAGAEQLVALGKFAGLLSIDCATQTAACHAAGARKLPTLAVRDKLHPGVQSRAALTALTGCR